MKSSKNGTSNKTNEESKAWADLHTHTSYSDGSLSPEELLRIAQQIGLKAIAITDHDSIDGAKQACRLAQRFGVEVIPAIELGTHIGDTEVHLLGYFIDVNSPALATYLHQIRQTRHHRAIAILKKLQTFGLHLKIDDVLKKAGHGSIGRPHIAAAMVERGLVTTFQEAFDLWIGDGRPAHVNKGSHEPEDLIALIHQAGGVAVLAHPGNRLSLKMLHRFIKGGLDGVEVLHPSHDETTRKAWQRLARQYGLLMTGGSDFHGFRTHANVFGSYVVPYKVVEQMRAYQARRPSAAP